MQLTLESQAVEVQLDDPRFPLARVWKGETEDGTPVMALIACVVARPIEAQPKLQAALAALPTELYANTREAGYLFGPNRIPRERAA